MKLTYRSVVLIVCTLLALLAGGLQPGFQVAAAAPGPVTGWGRGTEGQLGSAGGSAVAPRAAIGAASAGVTALAAGRNHSFALKADGTLYAFGSNNLGALGIDLARFESVSTPTQVVGLTGVTGVAAGGYHSVAVAGGAVYAWGTNEKGVNGPASSASACTGAGSADCDRSPVAVGLTGIKAVGAGYLHNLAVGEDGTVYAWGWNSYGQLGRTGVTQSATPAAVAGIDNVTAIGGGESHTLALRADGTVWAWGGNAQGQLGLGSADNTSHATPTQVPGLTGITAIAAGYRHNLALGADGTVYAWGHNENGQLGNGSVPTSGCLCVATATAVAGLANIQVIGAGEGHSLVVRADGAAFGFGANASTQLGITTPAKVASPTQIPGIADATFVAGGGSHSLGLQANVAPTHDLTALPSGPGTIELNPGGGRYTEGTQVTLVARPQGEALFIGWVIDGQPGSYDPTLTITMNANRAVTAKFAVPPSFCDVNQADQYFEAIRQLSARGIIRGITQNDGSLCFAPDEQTLRAQMAALVARPHGWDLEDHPAPFPDRGSVDDNLWASVGTLAFYNVARGFQDGTYRPLDPVLHAQTISFITRAMVTKGYWTAQADNPALYPNVPADSGHRADIATYVFYVGALPGTGSTGETWAAWDQPNTRAWFAEALWRSLDSYFGLDQTP